MNKRAIARIERAHYLRAGRWSRIEDFEDKAYTQKLVGVGGTDPE